MYTIYCRYSFFFFNDTATTEIYTLSLHDALPISSAVEELLQHRYEYLGRHHVLLALQDHAASVRQGVGDLLTHADHPPRDRKSTRLNSSHANISYAVFCLKKKKHNRSLCQFELCI